MDQMKKSVKYQIPPRSHQILSPITCVCDPRGHVYNCFPTDTKVPPMYSPSKIAMLDGDLLMMGSFCISLNDPKANSRVARRDRSSTKMCGDRGSSEGRWGEGWSWR